MKKNEEIRINILNVAQNVLRRLGADKITMELIAKECGKSKSILYYYFKNKESLYAAVIEREGNLIMTELAQIINYEGTTKELLEKYSKKRFELTETTISNYKLSNTDYVKMYPVIQKYRRKYDEFEYFAIKQILIRGVQNNELNIKFEHIDNVALGITAAIKGLEIPLLIESSKNNINEKIDILLQLFLYGLLKK